MSTNPSRWPDGTRVSHRHRPDVTGTIKLVTRQIDGVKFAKVRPDALEHATFAGWANQDWMLGVGKSQADCLDCGQPYRYEPETWGDGFCPICNHEPTMSTLPETRSVKGSLYGARTPRKPAPVAAAVAEPEPFENPFD